ncbi:MAG TPA: GGDEF domain-containing phosphodiesterase [Aquihabitans sp.]|nr:GGDEF domain-containing phosphodiesterase [Aquihabitans sp.]
MGVRREVAEHLVATGGARGRFDGVLAFLRLEGLWELNDRFGRDAVDRVLARADDRLAASRRSSWCTAHLGGGLFLVVAPRASPADGILDGLGHQLGGDLVIEDRVVSLGWVVTELELRDADVGSVVAATAVLEAAERRARAPATGPATLEPFDGARFGSVAGALEALRGAIDDGRVVARYQPVVDLADDRVVGAEALARWDGAPAGLDRPEDFLALAVVGGWMAELTDRTIDQVAADLARPELRRSGAWLGVNVGAADAVRPALPAQLAEAIAREHIDPGRVVVELSERLVPDPATTRAVHRLAETGVRLAIDDFGAGWSSLRQLTDLPVDVLKVDRSLLVARSATGAPLLPVAISVAKAMGLQVVVEGIETGTERTAAEEAGAELGQGFRWGEPAELEVLIGQLEDGVVTHPGTIAGGGR